MKKILLLALLLFVTIPTNALSIHMHYNQIMVHIYYTKRLAKSAYYLSLLHEQHYYYKPCNFIQQRECIHIDSVVFFHPKIISCINKMRATHSLEPLLLSFQDMMRYQYLQDYQFIHELFLLIFTVHKQILLHECDQDHSHPLKTITLDTIIEISEKINQLPIAEILNAIDMLVTELPPFLEKYEFHSKITWKEWLKKYWWVPPIFGAWFGLKILLRLQKPHFYFTPYSAAPKPIISVPLIETNDPALLEIRE